MNNFFIKHTERIVTVSAIYFAGIATYISLIHGWILAYADAESHLNISKKVVSSLTPGFAQLGGIWLPLTHILAAPLVAFDPLWRSGLAGSMVSGVFFVIACLYIYKLTLLLTGQKVPSFIAFLIFGLNFNVLYMQSTPMTELPLIAFFVLSSYYFTKYLLKESPLTSLIFAALFAFGASLVRYDGWMLVLVEAAITLAINFKWWKPKVRADSFILFSSLAFFGIALWLLWNGLILGDPLYFEHSQYSAKAQQLAWMQKGELAAYQNLFIALKSYLWITVLNGGMATPIAFAGFIVFLFTTIKRKFWIALVLLAPFIFNIITQYLGEDVIFAPGIVPSTFEWQLFNVRYGLLMVPFIAVFFGFLMAVANNKWAVITFSVLLIGTEMYFFSLPMQTITLADGLEGLSASKTPWAMENFLNEHYNGGYVLFDDYARTFSLVRSTIPMQDMIYVGVRPYWEESLKNPSKFARWIIIQQGDAIDKAITDKPPVAAELRRTFKEVFNQDQIQIWEKK